MAGPLFKMSLQGTVRDALTAIRSLASDSVVSVVSSGVTASGVKDTTPTGTDLSNLGEQGETTSRVFVSLADMSEPARGATITVAGDPVFVVGTEVDPVGAVMTISYSKQRPVEFTV
jgi:hypothetical protein